MAVDVIKSVITMDIHKGILSVFISNIDLFQTSRISGMRVWRILRCRCSTNVKFDWTMKQSIQWRLRLFLFLICLQFLTSLCTLRKEFWTGLMGERLTRISRGQIADPQGHHKWNLAITWRREGQPKRRPLPFQLTTSFTSGQRHKCTPSTLRLCTTDTFLLQSLCV